MNWITLAGVNGFMAIVLGAFGSHGLAKRLDPHSLEVWKIGVQYHLVMAAVLLALAIAHYPKRRFRKSLRLLFLGEFLFSGSLYFLATLTQKFLGYITPIGGVILLAGWLMVAHEGHKSLVKKETQD